LVLAKYHYQISLSNALHKHLDIAKDQLLALNMGDNQVALKIIVSSINTQTKKGAKAPFVFPM